MADRIAACKMTSETFFDIRATKGFGVLDILSIFEDRDGHVLAIVSSPHLPEDGWNGQVTFSIERGTPNTISFRKVAGR